MSIAVRQGRQIDQLIASFDNGTGNISFGLSHNGTIDRRHFQDVFVNTLDFLSGPINFYVAIRSIPGRTFG